MDDNKILIVGAGLAGSVMAERISTQIKIPVTIIDKRSHIGGTSYSFTDENGIQVHKYGSHIFHTSNKKVWDYVQRFTEMNNYHHHVLLKSGDKILTMPVNLGTINSVYGINMTPIQAMEMLKTEIISEHIENPSNLEEKAISMIGRKLYNECIMGYTSKQWNRNPKILPEQIIKRLPVRYNYDSQYFNDEYQGIPKWGYGEMVRRMLDNQNIELVLNCNFFDEYKDIQGYTVFYSGMIDEFFGYMFGKLEWRSLRFDFETVDVNDYQGTSVMNYNDIDIPFTRIHEFKHYQVHDKSIMNKNSTVICREYPQDWSDEKEAYYPVETQRNNELLIKYQKYASEKFPNVRFIGRLGQYRYFDMDDVIENSLNVFDDYKNELGVL